MECGWRFTIAVDPAAIGTAQQKRFDPRTSRFFTSRRVAAGMKAVTLIARAESRKIGARLPPWARPVALSLDFFYAVPKSRRRKGPSPSVPSEGEPCTARWAGDIDNRPKAVIDAMTAAGLWPDDQYVTRLEVSKRWTLGSPRIEVGVWHDVSRPTQGDADCAAGNAGED